jgi:hypothetical protein
MKRPFVKNERELASLIALAEDGKSQAKIGDIRQAIKILKMADLAATLQGRRSPLTLLRKMVLSEAKKRLGPAKFRRVVTKKAV